MGEREHYIYALTEPDTGEIRYIGQTPNPEQRFRRHSYSKSGSPVRRWIRSLALTGKTPGAVLLCRVGPNEDPLDVEQRFISANASARLLNRVDRLSDYTVLAAVRAMLEAGETAPTTRELGKRLGVSFDSINYRLRRLERRGLIRWEGARAIVLVRTPGHCSPIVRCACGISRVADRVCHECGSTSEAA